jgi:glycosyltransferase involved in cell wall biosynthesis
MQISIITATFNAANHLPALISSLRDQTYKNFEWVVADGGSIDDTLNILRNVKDLNVALSAQPDFGIYDALNRAIKASKGDYYVVIGADDVFEPDAIENFMNLIDESTAIITAPIMINNRKYELSKLPIFLSGFQAKIYGHSVATLFKKSLHDKHGYYSRNYPIAADYDFMMKLILANERISYSKKIAGKFSSQGVSTKDRLGSASEVMRVMVSHGYSLPVQVAVFILRLIYTAIVGSRSSL